MGNCHLWGKGVETEENVKKGRIDCWESVINFQEGEFCGEQGDQVRSCKPLHLQADFLNWTSENLIPGV